MAKEVPLGVRLNNPGNLEWGSPWQGLVPREKSRYYRHGSSQQKRFCEFIDAPSGIRAIARTLITYYEKRKAKDGSKIDTILEMVERWAPSFENNVKAYAAHVGRVVGVDPTDVLDFNDYDTIRALVVGIIAHENSGYRYPDAVIDEGLRRAGFVRRKAKASVPLNTETVAGAAVPALGGVATLAPLIDPLVDALYSQQDNLSSGQTIKILIGIALVLGAGFVAWSQLRKRKAGSV